MRPILLQLYCRLSSFAAVAWLPALTISTASLIISIISLTYVIANYRAQEISSRPNLIMQDVKFVGVYDPEPVISFTLQNESKEDASNIHFDFYTMHSDGTLRSKIANRLDVILRGNQARSYSRDHLNMAFFNGLFAICLSYNDGNDRFREASTNVFLLKDYKPGLTAAQGGGGENLADTVVNENLQKLACSDAR